MPRVKVSPLVRAAKIARILTMTLKRTKQAASLGTKANGRVDREGMIDAHLGWSSDLIDILGVDLKIEGEPVVSEPALFLCNHISYLDIPMLMQFVNRGNFGVYVSKAEVASWPVFGGAATAGGTIYVQRKDRDSRKGLSNSIRQAIREERHSVVIFPEGTSSLEPRSFKPGPFLAAKEHDLLIQPICLHYRPMRDTAFINDDALVPHLWNLVSYQRIEATLVALPPRKTSGNVDADSVAVRDEICKVLHELEARAPRDKSLA